MTEYPETQPQDLLVRDYPRLDWTYQSRIVPQYPESEEQVRERTSSTALELVEQFTGNMLLVGHSASVWGTSAGLVGGDPSLNLALGCLVKIVSCQEQWQIELNGDTSHLERD
jgi:broad specificity phosphatase PhoE